MMKMKMMGCGPGFQDKEFEMLTFYLARIKHSFSKHESTARRVNANYVLGKCLDGHLLGKSFEGRPLGKRRILKKKWALMAR